MGSGNRIKFRRMTSGVIGFGVYISRIPFNYTISFGFLFWWLEIGIGKAYDA